MKNIPVILLMLIGGTLVAQTKLIEKGDFNYEHHYYKEALVNYKEALNHPKLDEDERLHVKQYIAYSYYHLFDYDQAERAFASLFADTSNHDWNTHLLYGHSLMNNGKYNQALEVYQEYGTHGVDPNEVMRYVNSCKWALANQDTLSNYHVKLTNIETGGRSFGVAIFDDGLIYSQSQTSDFDEHTTFYDISYAKAIDSVTFGRPHKLTGSMNRSFYEGSPSITGDGKLMYYTGNASEREVYRERNRSKKNYHLSADGINILHIYVAEHSDTAWINSKELSFESDEYSFTHPSISQDGKTLYFVSNMPGGFGGYDVYRAEKLDSSWSAPTNMGPLVNSAENEMTPFILQDTLFFSSKGNLGYGGSDIYYALLGPDGMVEEVNNMGYPFNTPHDDFGLVTSPGQKSGYLSSNRQEIHGYDHVFYFWKEPPVLPPDTIIGITLNKVTGRPIPYVNLTIEPDTYNVMNVKKTDGNGRIEIVLPKSQEFLVTFFAEGYEPVEVTVPANSDERADVIARFGEFELIPIAKQDVVLEIDEIYFEYDKADIRDESEAALAKIIEYLNFYPDVRVELSAHTDSRGSDSYNKRLSQKRAESTVEYLVEHGIKVDRLVPMGYGETRLRNKCKNGVKCSDQEHMFNRRVELKVL